ncbi:Protein bric-a-brac 1-like Protein [Tribolium castaneum]|uniref:Protein bric-a-brac 1-like Protein n=1 Tax=Tribolium castaneum TaxID=7070 RepID=A0A139WHX1_TRICA|nr:Protein bric-a-brac 1-like Protein [Tribolium castaneum]
MGSDSNKEYSVNWKNHMDHMRKAFDNLLTSNELTDVTLCCEGRRIGAHKMLLSACSTYFRDTFKDVPCQHPVIILYGVEYSVLSDILHFIYNGEVSVDTSKLDSFLKTAQLLKISGLTDNSTENMASENSEQDTQAASRREQTEGAFSEQVSTASEDTKKGAKRRVQESEGAPTQTKVGRQESDTLFMSDVKSEPSEFVNYEDPLEDPLLQADPSNENREFFVTSQGGVEDEIKNRSRLLKVEKNGRRLSLNGYKYTANKRKYSKIYWRCHKYKCTKCNGRLTTDLEFNLINVNEEHVHPPYLL